MPTDDERREVARRLREMAEERFDFCAHNVALEIGLDDPSNFDDLFDDEHEEAWMRLADLIEPGELKTTCIAEVKIEGEKLDEAVNRAIAEYTGIDRDALLELADDLDRMGDGSMYDPCISDEYGIASRIREACGEGER